MPSEVTKLNLSPAEVAVALAIGSAAMLVLGLQPILLGELLEAKRLTLEGVGVVAMAEIVALGMGVLLGDLTQPLKRFRGVTFIAFLSALAFDALTLRASGDLHFALARVGAGVAEGMLLWAATAVIVRLPSPARVAGIFFVVQTLAQAITGLVLARAIIPTSGWQGAFVAVGALMLLPAFLVRGLPRTLEPLPPPTQTGFRWSRRTVVPMLAVFLQMSALGSMGAYVEPLGTSAGFDAKSVQTLIAAGLAMQIVGGSLSSALVHRLCSRSTLLAGSVVLGVVAMAMSPSLGTTPWLFAALWAVFSFTWVFVMPLQVAMAFEADSGGRLASLVPAVQLFGFAFGPLVSSILVEGENVSSVPLVSAAFAAVAVLALATALASRRAAATAA